MRAPVPVFGEACGNRKRQKAVERSLYFGRERLGRYVQLDRKWFKAFNAHDHLLGNFRKRARALAAIRKAWARLS